ADGAHAVDSLVIRRGSVGVPGGPQERPVVLATGVVEVAAHVGRGAGGGLVEVEGAVRAVPCSISNVVDAQRRVLVAAALDLRVEGGVAGAVVNVGKPHALANGRAAAG